MFAKRQALVLCIMLFSVVASYASEYAGEFLSIGVGARALGMGGAFTAVADDASAVYWNPAGMVEVKDVEVSSVKLISQSEIDSNYMYLSLAYNAGKETGAFGASFLSQSFNNIMLTDTQGNQVGGLKGAGDNTAYLSYARKITGWLSAGLTVKALFGNYPTGSGSTGYAGFGGDAGVVVDCGEISSVLKGLKAAVNAQDIYTAMYWGSGDGITGGEERIWVNIKSGIEYAPFADPLKGLNSSVVIAADYDTKYNGEYHLGGEYTWNDMIALRGGVKGYLKSGATPGQDGEWSVGAGIKWYFIGIDYAFVNSGMSPLQYISISGRF